MTKNVFTLGRGFIASHIPYPRIIERLDPTPACMGKVLDTYKPDVLVNCVGFCGAPNVDQCEVEKEKTNLTNTVIPLLLAAECVKRGIQLIQIGSGCIFYGASPNQNLDWVPNGLGDVLWENKDTGWKETDFPNPQSYYSRSKAACDLGLDGMFGVSILRIRMPVSSKNSPRNLINKLAGYSKVIDVPNSMTMCDDLARCVAWGVEKEISGIWNVVNPGTITAAGVMKEFQKYRPEHKFEVISEDELYTSNLCAAKRSNCVLDGSKLKEVGFEMTPAKEGLERVMREYFTLYV
jgi:dTDP-4-dehydrorhamnose reductase